MTRWYRRYVGTVNDPKIAEAAMIAACSRSTVIAIWDAILESAAEGEANGAFKATSRNVAATLQEQHATVMRVFAALEELNMVSDGVVLAWSKRQYQSDSSTSRSRKHREEKKNNTRVINEISENDEDMQRDATLHDRCATAPDTERKEVSKKESKIEPIDLQCSNYMSETRVSDEGLGDEGPRVAKPRKPYPEDFETFWRAYPDRTNNSKPNAAAAWKRLTAEDRAAALTSLPRFKGFLASKPDLGCVHAERYLKQRRFEGFAEAHQSATDQTWWQDPAKVAMLTPSQWKGSISKHANGIWSVDKLGPAPGHPKCVVPEAIIAELKLTERYTPAGISRGAH